MNKELTHKSKERINDFGEVFTPNHIVMLLSQNIFILLLNHMKQKTW